mmetsp:Transcript_35794/g.66750  ORF Transcript_35794/g.66750 Transcript_35794/m.66750 type:complete len:217 (+) Transcript_35794:508-1158(+)
MRRCTRARRNLEAQQHRRQRRQRLPTPPGMQVQAAILKCRCPGLRSTGRLPQSPRQRSHSRRPRRILRRMEPLLVRQLAEKTLAIQPVPTTPLESLVPAAAAEQDHPPREGHPCTRRTMMKTCKRSGWITSSCGSPALHSIHYSCTTSPACKCGSWHFLPQQQSDFTPATAIGQRLGGRSQSGLMVAGLAPCMKVIGSCARAIGWMRPIGSCKAEC